MDLVSLLNMESVTQFGQPSGARYLVEQMSRSTNFPRGVFGDAFCCICMMCLLFRIQLVC